MSHVDEHDRPALDSAERLRSIHISSSAAVFPIMRSSSSASPSSPYLSAGTASGSTSYSTTASSQLTDNTCDDIQQRSGAIRASEHDPSADDDSMLFDGFSQDMATEADALADAYQGCQYPETMDVDEDESQQSGRSVSMSDSSDLDSDADHELVLQGTLGCQTSPLTLPDVTNAELEEALETLDIDRPVVFPEGASQSTRRCVDYLFNVWMEGLMRYYRRCRALVKQKLCDYALSLVIRLTLSTTPNYIRQPTPGPQDTQPESQYRAVQAKIAERALKPNFDPVSLKLRNRNIVQQEPSIRRIEFPGTVASTRQLGRRVRMAQDVDA